MKSARFCEILKEIAWTAGLTSQEVPDAPTLEHWAQTQQEGEQNRMLCFLQMTDGADQPLAGSFSLERVVDGSSVSFCRHTANEMGFAAVWLCPGVWRIRAGKGLEYTSAGKTGRTGASANRSAPDAFLPPSAMDDDGLGIG